MKNHPNSTRNMTREEYEEFKATLEFEEDKGKQEAILEDKGSR